MLVLLPLAALTIDSSYPGVCVCCMMLFGCGVFVPGFPFFSSSTANLASVLYTHISYTCIRNQCLYMQALSVMHHLYILVYTRLLGSRSVYFVFQDQPRKPFINMYEKCVFLERNSGMGSCTE